MGVWNLTAWEMGLIGFWLIVTVALISLLVGVLVRSLAPTWASEERDLAVDEGVAVSHQIGSRDPVCGMLLKPDNINFSRVYGGQTYHFCCPVCQERFVREPERFVSKPSQQEMRIRVVGFSCAGDAAALERRLKRIAGVRNAVVNPLTELAYITFDPNQINLPALEREVRQAGYRTGTPTHMDLHTERAASSTWFQADGGDQ